jgi:hypothetical protein
MLEFHLKAKIKTLNSNTLQSIDASHTIHYDPIANKSGIPASIHLKRSANNKYTIYAFGKNGEIKKDHEITLRFKHTFVRDPVSVLLKTNDQGFIDLGELNGIQYIDYSNSWCAYKQWPLFGDSQALLPPAVCISAHTDFKLVRTGEFDHSLYSLYRNGNE